MAIRKRSNKGLLASLYEYVNLDGKKSAAEAAKELGIAEADIKGNRGSAGCSPHFFPMLNGICADAESA